MIEEYTVRGRQQVAALTERPARAVNQPTSVSEGEFVLRSYFVVVGMALLAPGAMLGMASPKSRLIVMADMGNEPDEEQQMAHLLMCANMVDLEGLITWSGKYLRADRTDGRTKVHPESCSRSWWMAMRRC
jgi:hypothetical protein